MFKRSVLIVFALLAVLVFGISSASAAPAAPGWTVDPVAAPTNFSVKDNPECSKELTRGSPEPVCDAYQVDISNAGSAPTNGEPVTVTDTLPAGVTVQKEDLFSSAHPGADFHHFCTVAFPTVVCKLPGEYSALAPDGTLQLIVYVTVNEPEAAGPVTNTASVSGGGAPEVKSSRKNEISSSAPSFGPANFDFYIAGADGARDTQAADHPYELTTTIDFNSVFNALTTATPFVSSVHDLKEVVVDLPLGFAGSTLAAAQCTLAQLTSFSRCPADTTVGHITTEPVPPVTSVNSGIWNLVPERGVPAEFGYVDQAKLTHVFYVHVVPTPAGYVLQVTSPEIPQFLVNHISVTFYGDPAVKQAEMRQHETEREVGHSVPLETPGAPVPFFTDPSNCSVNPVTGLPESLKATIYMDSWQNPGTYNPAGTPEGQPNWVSAVSESPPVTGCNELPFAPELKAQPTTLQADSPSGLEFELKLPQSETPESHATPVLKDLTVTFPEGMTVDPSAAGGLGTCSEAQIGWVGPTLFDFTPNKPDGAGGCPENSKIGSLELETPLIPRVLHGEVFLAAQNENPFGSTFATYIVVNDPITGVVLKIAGELKLDNATGRLTAVFDEFPQLPFSDASTHFFGGPRAQLATPPNCGTYTTNSELLPWSAEGSDLPATPFDSYVIDEHCAIGFAPSFAALTSNVKAGGYSSFLGSFSREDSDQELSGLTMSLPPGLLADVASVPLCGEAQVKAEEADAPGGCPAATQVGTVVAEAGPGPNPLSVPGKVYLTGPYNGGPYGLAVVVAANPGPFHFGNVVVRQSLRIDPNDAHVTAVSDSFPTFIHPRGTNGQVNGVPIKLRRVNFNIDRPGFTFNPTSCAKLAVTGAITSTQGARSNLAVPFQAGECQGLKFAPKFAVSTSGKTSRSQGASLAVKLTYPQGPQGTYANIARVKVDLPKQLPSRLTTLQKACTAAQFNANPAGCPAASIIGHAKAVTPLLPVALEGPAIFVSHGGEAFPSLIMVLQGSGVTLDLVGTTFISKTGITSSTFKTVPDAPVGSFELKLPQGKFSALAANGNLCKSKLTMPTEFLAQNGAKINESTKITVTGCAKAHKAKKGRHAKRTKRR
jgi:Domain of unknown function DUF11